MKAALLLALFAATLPAYAAKPVESLAFIRLDGGQSKFNQVSSDTWMASLGYNVNRHLAVETAYRKLARVTGATVTDSASGQAISDARVDLTALQLNLLASLPVTEQFSLHALVGWTRNQLELSRPGAVIQVPNHQSGAVVGAGLRWKLENGVSIYAEHTVFPSVDEVGIDKVKVTSLGLGFGF
ncbi:porin family protein [Chitinimonas sp. BJYL2]|uniref:porin family protein n=1 Tax=Chitinimonas sp. BJYL2 TaxID=2976696 RepID=UPI0022B5A41A|nr:porin family protein [Chitinimonas sp. BJYL2]